VLEQGCIARRAVFYTVDISSIAINDAGIVC